MTARSLPRTTRVAVAAAAALATVIGSASAAFADDEPTPGTTEAPEATPDPSATPTEPAQEPADDATDTPGATDGDEATTPDPKAADEVTKKPTKKVAAAEEADFGVQKFRVGARQADGSYVPAGSTTAGTTFELTFSLPGEPDEVIECTTEADLSDDTGATYCPGDDISASRLARAVPPGVDVDPDDVATIENEPQLFFLEPGESVTIRQVDQPDAFGPNPQVRTIEPCEALFAGFICLSSDEVPDDLSDLPFQTTKVVFENVGTPPTAVADQATTTAGKSVEIDVLANDDDGNGAPFTALAVETDPKHGTAVATTASGLPSTGAALVAARQVRAAATPGSPVISYTPQAGFTGVDAFTYTTETANGTTSAVVRVTVKDGVVQETDGALPDAGAPSSLPVVAGSLMVAAGIALVGRRRRVTPTHRA